MNKFVRIFHTICKKLHLVRHCLLVYEKVNAITNNGCIYWEVVQDIPFFMSLSSHHVNLWNKNPGFEFFLRGCTKISRSDVKYFTEMDKYYNDYRIFLANKSTMEVSTENKAVIN